MDRDWLYNPKPLKKQYKLRDANIADIDIKYCTECHRCYTTSDQSHLKNIEHFSNFPSYGKKKEVCITCKTRERNRKKRNSPVW